MNHLRLLLVDDSPVFLDTAAAFLGAYPQLQVVGQASSADDAIDKIAHLHPDLVLMDLSMPGMNGLVATRLIKEQPDPPQVIILTIYDQPHYHAAALSSGADAFLTKDSFTVLILTQIVRLFPTLAPFFAQSMDDGQQTMEGSA